MEKSPQAGDLDCQSVEKGLVLTGSPTPYRDALPSLPAFLGPKAPPWTTARRVADRMFLRLREDGHVLLAWCEDRQP